MQLAVSATYAESADRVFAVHSSARIDREGGRKSPNRAEGMDGVYFNVAHKQLYVSGGRDCDVRYIFVYQQIDADRYEAIGKIPTKPGAGTSFWLPELNRDYVEAPAHNDEEAAILVFEPQP